MKSFKNISRVLLLVVILIASAVLMTSCGDKPGNVDEATITYDGYSFVWQAPEKAHSYTVNINGSEFVTTINTYAYTVSSDAQTVSISITPIGKKGGEGETTTKTFSRLADVTNLSFDESGTLTWDAVTGASAYIVEVNGATHEVYDCRFTDFTPGVNNTVRVKASSTTNTTFSYFSKSISAHFLATPTNVSYDGSTISWTGTSKAEGYEVYINGTIVYSDTQRTCQYNAGGNDFSVEVKAIGNGSTVFDSGLSVAEEYIYLDQVVNFTVDSGNLDWEDVPDAIGYEVYVGSSRFDTKVSEYKDLATGRTNIVKVKPYGESKEHTHYFSDWSEEQSIHILNYPTTNWVDGLTPDNGNATSNFTWQFVTGEIEGYEVKIVLPDGEVVTDTCSDLTQSYPYAFETVGTYYISVKTIADKAAGSGFYDSSYSPEIVVIRLPAPNKAATFITSTANNLSEGFHAFIQNDTQASGYRVYREGVAITGYSVNNNATGGVRDIKITEIVGDNLASQLDVTYSIQSLGGKKTAQGQTIVTLPSNTNASLEFTVTVLATPSNTTIEGDVYMWDSVAGANGYYVTGDGGDSAGQNSFSLKNIGVGTHDMKVCAQGNGAEILASPYSAPLKAFKLAAPINLRIIESESGGSFDCSKVDHATSYAAIVNGSTEYTPADKFDEAVYQKIDERGITIAVVAIANYYEEATQTYYITSDPSNSIHPYKLATPTFGGTHPFVGTEMIWNAPSNSDPQVYSPTYKIFNAADRAYEDGEVGATKYNLAGYGPGTYQFQVKAIGDGITRISSDLSDVVTIEKLAAPVLTYSSDLKAYTFNGVMGAQDYVIRIDGEIVKTINASEGVGGVYTYVPTALEKIGEYNVSITSTSISAMDSTPYTIKQLVKRLATPEFTYYYSHSSYNSDGFITVEVTNPNANASGYIYYIAGATSILQETTSYSHNPQNTGTFMCGVQAGGGKFDAELNPDGTRTYYISSAIAGNDSNSTITLLGTPSNAEFILSSSSGMQSITWSPVTNAKKYEIVIYYADNTTETYTTQNATTRLDLTGMLAEIT